MLTRNLPFYLTLTSLLEPFPCSRVLVVKHTHFPFSHFANSRSRSFAPREYAPTLLQWFRISNSVLQSTCSHPSICTHAPFIFLFSTHSLFVAVAGNVESTSVRTGDRSQRDHSLPSTDRTSHGICCTDTTDAAATTATAAATATVSGS